MESLETMESMKSSESKERKMLTYIEKIINDWVKGYYKKIAHSEKKEDFEIQRDFFDYLSKEGIIEYLSDSEIEKEILKNIITSFCVKFRMFHLATKEEYGELRKYVEFNDYVDSSRLKDKKEMSFWDCLIMRVPEEIKTNILYTENKVVDYFDKVLELMCKKRMHIKLDTFDLTFDKVNSNYFAISHGKYELEIPLNVKRDVDKYWNSFFSRRILYKGLEKGERVPVYGYVRECLFIQYLLIKIRFYCGKENKIIGNEEVIVKAFEIFQPNRKYSNLHYNQYVYINKIMQSEVEKLIGLDDDFVKSYAESIEENAEDRIRYFLRNWGYDEDIIYVQKYIDILNEIISICKVNKYKSKLLEETNLYSCLIKIQSELDMNFTEVTEENYIKILCETIEEIVPDIGEELLEKYFMREEYDIKKIYRNKLNRIISDVERIELLSEKYAQYEFLVYGCFHLIFRKAEQDLNTALNLWDMMYSVLTIYRHSDIKSWENVINKGIKFCKFYQRVGRGDIMEIEKTIEDMEKETIEALLADAKDKKTESQGV